MSHIFLDFVIPEPMLSPMGCIAASEPSVNSPIPIMSRNAPIMNAESTLFDTGATLKQSTRTTSVIGSTDFKDSLSFSLNFLLPNIKSSVLNYVCRISQKPMLYNAIYYYICKRTRNSTDTFQALQRLYYKAIREMPHIALQA